LTQKNSSIRQANRKFMNPQVLAWHTSNLIMRMLRECFAAWIGMSPPVSVNICTDVPAGQCWPIDCLCKFSRFCAILADPAKKVKNGQKLVTAFSVRATVRANA
jgi:hypothetical protein